MSGNEYLLSFEHNGNPFSDTDAPYRFDDVTNLILPVSGKDNEFQTGKFGTGFLSTHILSLKIRVEGVFLNNEHELNDFDFTIDRTKFNNQKPISFYTGNMKLPVYSEFSDRPITRELYIGFQIRLNINIHQQEY
jgi:hypothetical protein